MEAFVCEELCTSAEIRAAFESVRASGAEVLNVSPNVYEKLAYGERSDGIVVVAEMPQRTLRDLRLPREPMVAVLEGIEKPGNLGAILRTADAAGIDAVILADCRMDLYNPNAIRASLGTIFRDNLCEAPIADTIAWLEEQGLRVVAARVDAELLYTECDLRGGVAIAFGSEAKGLTAAWSGENVTPVRLPMRGIADSLNVSTTAAVLFYEALRQRTVT